MFKASKNFTQNQCVYAKVRGYPYWPAQIKEDLGRNRYTVYFFGTHEEATVKGDAIKLYDEIYQLRFNTEKNMKKTDYKNAVKLIEQYLGTDSTSTACNRDNAEMENETVEEVEHITFELDPKKKMLLNTQHKLLCNIDIIKLNLGFDEFHIMHSFQLLEGIKKEAMPHVCRLMFLKFPDVVNTLMKLKNYKGNTRAWKMLENELEMYEKEASMIRSLATEIIDGIQKLLEIGGDQEKFWLEFKVQAAEFKDCSRNVDYGDLLLALTDEEVNEVVQHANEANVKH